MEKLKWTRACRLLSLGLLVQKLDNASRTNGRAFYASVRVTCATFRGMHSRRLHTRSLFPVLRSRLIGCPAGSRVKIPPRAASAAAHRMHTRAECIHRFIPYLMSSQFPGTSPVGSSPFRRFAIIEGKVGRTVSTFRKAAREP